MKAVCIHEFGGPEVLKIDEIPKPEPGEGEVLLRIQAASVNPVDYKIRNGGYLARGQLPVVMGRDVCGVVERCGPGVTRLRPGDSVYAMLPRDRGGYAEYVAVKADDCAGKPGRIDEIQAAAVPLAALTAWQGLFDHGGLQKGQHVLIHGASGGVGHFAVQFARAKGAAVSATARGGDREFLRRLGADCVIDYKTERFEDAVQDVDIVFDLVNGETQERSWDALHDGGILVSTLKQPSSAKAAKHHVRGETYMAHPDGGQLDEIARMIDAGAVTPVVDLVYALPEAAAAESRLEQEHVQGKIVLQVA